MAYVVKWKLISSLLNLLLHPFIRPHHWKIRFWFVHVSIFHFCSKNNLLAFHRTNREDCFLVYYSACKNLIAVAAATCWCWWCFSHLIVDCCMSFGEVLPVFKMNVVIADAGGWFFDCWFPAVFSCSMLLHLIFFVLLVFLTLLSSLK